MNELTISHLNFSYGNQKVLKELSIDIRKGKFYSILGPNGSGKTTILRHIQKLLLPQSGKVLLGQDEVRLLKVRDIAKKIATVPQETHIAVDFSVLDFVLAGRAPHLRRFENETPVDYKKANEAMLATNTWQYAHKSVRELSGGELQRVVVARAMVQEPELFLLDEPVSHLDLRHQILILDTVMSYCRRQESTVISVLHDINLAITYSDELIFMKKGRVYAKGKPEEIITEPILKEVYETECIILKNPIDGRPYVIPKINTRSEKE